MQLGVGLLRQRTVLHHVGHPVIHQRRQTFVLRRRQTVLVDRVMRGMQRRTQLTHGLAQRRIRDPALAVVQAQRLGAIAVLMMIMAAGRQTGGGGTQGKASQQQGKQQRTVMHGHVLISSINTRSGLEPVTLARGKMFPSSLPVQLIEADWPYWLA
ncbi:hypothetical protein D3C77_601140 [compost metagenome]